MPSPPSSRLDGGGCMGERELMLDGDEVARPAPLCVLGPVSVQG